MSLKIVIVDHREEGFKPEKDAFSAAGAEIIILGSVTEDQLIEAAKDAEILIFTFSKITASLISRLSSCRMLIRYGIGLDNVDIDAATRRGILVCNAPSYGSFAVAEHTFALLLALNRKVLQLDRNTRDRVWGIDPILPVHSLQNRTLGIFGFGNIGRHVSRMAMAFEMKVIVCDPNLKEAELSDASISAVTFDELITGADHISIHAPLNSETRHLFNIDVFRKMKSSATLINTSRGSIINEEDLVDTLSGGMIAGAALDVYENEPVAPGSKLLTLPNVVLSPHVAWYTEESIINLHREVVDEVIRFINGDLPLNIVNRKLLGL
jgi:D-3-phosphoglycerate dehydrogenase